MGEYPFIFAAACSFVSGCLLLWVNPGRGINRVFFGTSIWISLWFGCVVMAIREGRQFHPDLHTDVIFWLRLDAIVAAFFPWFLWLSREVIVDTQSGLRRILKRSWTWLIVPVCLASLSMSEWYLPSWSSPQNWSRGPGYIVYSATLAGIGVWFLVQSARQDRTLTGVRRIEVQFLVFAPLAACILLVTSNAIGTLTDYRWIRRISPLWFLLMNGMTMWAIGYYRVFDAKQLLISAAHRLTLSAFATATGWGAGLLAPPVLGYSGAIALGSLVGCISALLFNSPTKKLFGLDPRQRITIQRKQIIEWAREESDESKLKERFEMLLQNWCHTDRAVLIPNGAEGPFPIPFDWSEETMVEGGWITPESLRRRKPLNRTNEHLAFFEDNRLGALLITPKDSPHPSLIVALGTKTSLRPYTYPDIQLLLELAELMDNILTHSRVAAHAAKLERMEGAMMMSRGLAHDLNNLVTPVSTFLLHMEGRVGQSSAEQTVFAEAKDSLNGMQDYIRESLFFSRRLEPELEALDLRELLDSVARLTEKRAAERGVKVAAKSIVAGYIVADRALLQRLFQNLVHNAMDASASGQRVEISTRLVDRLSIEFRITDEGTGIPSTIAERIFEPYFTTKDTGNEPRGLGLGLAICQRIVELHRGRIAAVRNAPSGTVFIVTLPLQQAALDQKPRRSSSVPPLEDPSPATPISAGQQYQ